MAPFSRSSATIAKLQQRVKSYPTYADQRSEEDENAGIHPLLTTGGTSYRVFRSDREGRRGGGVAIIVRKSLSVCFVESGQGIEACCVDISSPSRAFRLLLCYRPPNASKPYVNELLSFIKRLGQTKRILFLLGDINYPELRGCLGPIFSSDKMALSFQSTVSRLSLTQLCQHPSREGSDNILDMIFVSSHYVGLVSSIDCFDTFSSADHFKLSFSFRFERPRKQKPTLFCNFRKARYGDAASFLIELIGTHVTLRAHQ